MTRQIVHTDQAPAAIGPYSQAVISRGVVSTAGQIALDAKTGDMVGAGDITSETAQVMQNLKEILAAAGSSISQCLRCTVYLADLSDFEAFNDVYGAYFKSDPPARVTIEAAGLPRGARVEISATAIVLE